MTVSSARATSPRRVPRLDGAHVGVAVTERDKKRLVALARWYTLSAGHITRMERDASLWHPSSSALSEAEVRRKYATAVDTTRRRFYQLARVEERPGTSIGPLLGASRTDAGATTYWVTRYGVTEAELPWQFKPGIYEAFTQHAWFAADIGMQIERAGFRVLSERELSSGLDRFHDVVGQRFTSYFEQPSGGRVTKKPDVAVLSPHNDDYLAVEVERHQRKQVRQYVEKLQAYQLNSRVRAVWYICNNKTTADRVFRAANKVFGQTSQYPLRIRIADQVGDWYEVPGLARDRRLLADLEAVS